MIYVNNHIRCDEVVVQNSRLDAMKCPANDIPDGWTVIQVGPSWSVLMQQLAALQQIASAILETHK